MKPAIILTACGVGLALTVALTSCSTDTQVVTPEQRVDVASGKVPGRLAVAERMAFTRIWDPKLGKCTNESRSNCADTIIVEGERPKLFTQIANLDDAIVSGNTSHYFASPSNYSEIWSSIPAAILSDLLSGRASMRRAGNVPQNRRDYYVVDVSGNGIDYSGVN